MSLLERHRYMITRIAEAFGYDEDEGYVEAMMLIPECHQAIDFFFTVEGPTKIIVTLENNTQEVAEKDEEPLPHFLKINFKELDYVPHTSVYFMKSAKESGKDKIVEEKIAIKKKK